MKIRIGIDAGTTVTKLAAMKNGQLFDHLRVDSEPSDADIHLLYELLVEKHHLTDEDIASINITGVGATGFTDKLGNIVPTYVHEFDADVAGAEYLAKGINDFLLISLGTGTTFLRVTDNKAHHIGGLGMGGGTVKGLAKYMTNSTNVYTLDNLAKSGSLSNVNFTMKDVSKATFEGLMEDLTASNFGKTYIDAKIEDLAAGIYSLVLENCIQTGCMLAKQLDVNTIVLIGGLCNSGELDRCLKLFRMMYPDFNFIVSENGSYNTAIGTALISLK